MREYVYLYQADVGTCVLAYSASQRTTARALWCCSRHSCAIGHSFIRLCYCCNTSSTAARASATSNQDGCVRDPILDKSTPLVTHACLMFQVALVRSEAVNYSIFCWLNAKNGDLRLPGSSTVSRGPLPIFIFIRGGGRGGGAGRRVAAADVGAGTWKGAGGC